MATIKRNNGDPKNEMLIIQLTISELFTKISLLSSYKESQSIFDILQEIQYCLSFTSFVEKIDFTPTLNQFISDFERLDDEWTRQYYYPKIKSKEYSMESGNGIIGSFLGNDS